MHTFYEEKGVQPTTFYFKQVTEELVQKKNSKSWILIYGYLAEQNLLFDFRSGLRKAHSTDTCLLYLTDFIGKEVDKGNFFGMVLKDLQKVFDTVQYDILLNKLKALGFSDTERS